MNCQIKLSKNDILYAIECYLNKVVFRDDYKIKVEKIEEADNDVLIYFERIENKKTQKRIKEIENASQEGQISENNQ